MRITTGMLNAASAESGIALNSSSLLNYIDNSTSDNSLLAAMQKNKTNKTTEQKSGYEKLGNISEKLADKAAELAAQGKDSVFERAREKGSNEEIWKYAEELVGNFNSLAKELGTSSTELDAYYRKMLLGSAGDNAEALSQVGITQEKDGTLKIDKEKMKAADVDTLEKVLGRAGGFSSKVALISGRIAQNAQAGAESLSSRYDASGNSWSMPANKYDFWG